jgi:hypothetical protein
VSPVHLKSLGGTCRRQFIRYITVSKRVATSSVALVRAVCECFLVRTHCDVPCRVVHGKSMERGEKINVLSSIFALGSVQHPILLPWSVDHLVVRECRYSIYIYIYIYITYTTEQLYYGGVRNK